MERSTLLIFRVLLVVFLTELRFAKAWCEQFTHLQELYHQSDYVVDFKILKSNDVNATAMYYDVKPYDILSATVEATKLLTAKNVTLWTEAGYPGIIQSFLEPKEKYVISGKIVNGKLYTGGCDVAHSEITPYQRVALRKYYAETNCRVGGKNTISQKDGCTWIPFTPQAYCQQRFTVCSRDESNLCSWKKTPGYAKCLSQRYGQISSPIIYLARGQKN